MISAERRRQTQIKIKQRLDAIKREVAYNQDNRVTQPHRLAKFSLGCRRARCLSCRMTKKEYDRFKNFEWDLINKKEIINDRNQRHGKD